MNPVMERVKKNPKTIEEAREHELALVAEYLVLRQQRENIRGQIDEFTKEMNNIQYMVYATREMIKLFEKKNTTDQTIEVDLTEHPMKKGGPEPINEFKKGGPGVGTADAGR